MHYGRPLEYTPDRCQSIIELRRNGCTVEEVAAEWNVSKQTIYNWTKAEPAFMDAFMRAKEMYEAWFWALGRENIRDYQDKGTGYKFNDRIYKFIGAAQLGYSEKTMEARRKILPEEFYNTDTTLERKQAIIDEYVAVGNISTGMHESLSKSLSYQFERRDGIALKEAAEVITKKERETK